MEYKTVKVSGTMFGGPLYITPTDEKPYVVSITTGGIHPFAQKIADLSGGKIADAFKTAVKNAEMACVVVDCGGSARCGVYPMKRIPTINTNPLGKSGFLGKYMTPDIYVSGVSLDTIELSDKSDVNK